MTLYEQAKDLLSKGHEPRHVAALLGASEATVLRLKEVLDRIPVAEEPAPPKDDRTTDDWAEQVAPQFVKDVDTHIEMMSELRGAVAYQLRRLIVISLRQLFRDKNLQ